MIWGFCLYSGADGRGRARAWGRARPDGLASWPDCRLRAATLAAGELDGPGTGERTADPSWTIVARPAEVTGDVTGVTEKAVLPYTN